MDDIANIFYKNIKGYIAGVVLDYGVLPRLKAGNMKGLNILKII